MQEIFVILFMDFLQYRFFFVLHYIEGKPDLP